MNDVTVRPFRANEWDLYRDARLRALKEAPNAFGSTYAQSKLLGDGEWQARLDRVQPGRDLPLGAFSAKQVAGMCWTKIYAEEESAHLYQMWVAPSFRGSGIGRRLLDFSIGWVRDLEIETLILGVTEGETPARSLYESVGFSPTGSKERLRPESDLYVQVMALNLLGT